MTKVLNETQQELAELIYRVFEDGVVQEAERDAIRKIWRTGALTGHEVFDVLDAFVSRIWEEVTEDGVISDKEQARLRTVIDGLHLPNSVLPERLRLALSRETEPDTPL